MALGLGEGKSMFEGLLIFRCILVRHASGGEGVFDIGVGNSSWTKSGNDQHIDGKKRD